jgi:hypothetical protein
MWIPARSIVASLFRSQNKTSHLVPFNKCRIVSYWLAVINLLILNIEMIFAL